MNALKLVAMYSAKFLAQAKLCAGISKRMTPTSISVKFSSCCLLRVWSIDVKVASQQVTPSRVLKTFRYRPCLVWPFALQSITLLYTEQVLF